MPSKLTAPAACTHSAWTPDPWETGTTRCLYCGALFEDVMPLRLPPHPPVRPTLNSRVLRQLRFVRPPAPVRPPWHARR